MELAREVARRGNHFYSIWLNSEEEGVFKYTQAQLDSYQEGLDWLNWMCAQDVEGVNFVRGQKVRRMCPQHR